MAMARSSNSSGCSRVGSLQYFSSSSDLLSLGGGDNSAAGIGDMNQVLVSSANSSAGGSSITTGANSVPSGNSPLQRNMSINTDSLASSGAVSTGLPTSPLSFSSSNVSLPGSSCLGSSSLSQPGITPVTRFESQQDPSVQPSKLLKSSSSHFSQLVGHQNVQSVQHFHKFGKRAYQPNEVHNIGTSHHRMGSDISSSQELMRIGHRFRGQDLTGVDREYQNGEQQLAQLHASMAAAKVMRGDLLQLQAAQNILQSPNSALSAQLQRHEALQQQSQHVQAQLLQQQRLLQQEQILRMMPPQLQRSRFLQQQHQLQQLQQQIVGLTKESASAVGLCMQRLTQYMHHQRMHPADNNICFWREFVSEYFAPHARKRWCLSQYGAGGGRQPMGVFPQDLWHCEICGSSPGRGFEATAEIMPRLLKTKYEHGEGELEELLFVDLPYEYKLSSGLTVLEYRKAVQESVFEQSRVVWEGQLRIVFTSDLKILSWDFCAKSHEELLPRGTVVPQVNQLVSLASKYQSAVAQSNGTGLSAQDLQANCNMFVSSARQMVRSLDPPSVNELGFTKRFVRCVQIAEVVNCMKDLIDFSLDNSLGPMESLQRFPCRKRMTSGEIPSLPLQSNVAVLAPFGTEQNAAFLKSMQFDMDKWMGSAFNRQVNGHVNHLPHFQSLRQNSNSSQSVMQIDSSGAGFMPNSLQASPTSSLTSLQTSVSSLTSNSQAILSNLQNSLPPNSGNLNPLQPLQCDQQNINNVMQHLFREMTNPKPSSGGMFHHGAIGNAGMDGSVNGMIPGLATFPDHGSLGINSGNIRSHFGGLASSCSSLIGSMGGGNRMNLANSLRHSGHSLPQMGNIETPRTLGTWANSSSLAREQEMQLQDNNLQPDLDVTGAQIWEGIHLAGSD